MTCKCGHPKNIHHPPSGINGVCQKFYPSGSKREYEIGNTFCSCDEYIKKDEVRKVNCKVCDNRKLKASCCHRHKIVIVRSNEYNVIYQRLEN